MRLDKAIVSARLVESYVEAQTIIFEGSVKVNRNIVKEPWKMLKGGHYFVKITGKGLYKFSVKHGKIRQLKEVTA